MGQYEEEIMALEEEELKCPSADVTLYVRLMAYYLVENKLFDARLLWSRIPPSLKTDNQLQKLILLQKALANNNLNSFFKNIRKSHWSGHIKTAMNDLENTTKKNILLLVGNAYTSISKENVIELADLNEDELKKICLELDWSLESNGEQLVIHPRRVVFNMYSKVDSEYQISKLTKFVSFLEN